MTNLADLLTGIIQRSVCDQQVAVRIIKRDPNRGNIATHAKIVNINCVMSPFVNNGSDGPNILICIEEEDLERGMWKEVK